MKKYSWGSFFLILMVYTTIAYSIYSNIHNTWLITPPNYVILIASSLALIFGIVGLFEKSTWYSKLRSWLTTILSIIIIFALLITMSFTTMFSGTKELLTTVQSPDNKYNISFYRTDAGGMGTFGVLGELNGRLWFKKKIYVEKRVDQVHIEWQDNHTILINHHELDLMKGETLHLH